jgi:hypothetical protein
MPAFCGAAAICLTEYTRHRDCLQNYVREGNLSSPRQHASKWQPKRITPKLVREQAILDRHLNRRPDAPPALASRVQT